MARPVKYTTEEVREFYKNRNEQLLSEYVRSTDKLLIRCENGHEYTQLFKSSRKGHGCKKCYDIDHSVKFSDIMRYYSDRGETLLSKEYTDNRSKLKIKCEYGHIYYQSANVSRLGHGCSVCRESKGERCIRNILDEKQIKYKREYTLDGCVYKQKLQFDFAIMSVSDNLLGLIEFNGEQHYKPLDVFGGTSSFNEQCKKDKIKKEYCEQQNIPFYILSYKDFRSNTFDKKINKIIGDIHG